MLGGMAAALLACAAGALLAWREPRPWRRAIVALGFPASALAAGVGAGWPAWVWLAPLALLVLAYPLRAWGDAPLFPTPPGALDALATQIMLPAGARVLDAGCGVGDGLRALRRAWPQARVEGVELSLALAWLARRRCPWARVDRADMWARPWHGAALVYLFQRPETMARAWDKASAELAPGAWLVSLAFGVPGRPPTLSLPLAGGRVLHAWRMPGAPAGGRARRRRDT
jgi:SAM-dependent methyltransferase